MLPLQIREATANDAETLTGHRRAMFSDMGIVPSLLTVELDSAFHQWVTKQFAQGTYKSWLAIDGNIVVAGADLWLIEGPPRPTNPKGKRGYILNVYTQPAYRRQGLARQLVEALLVWCYEATIPVVELHASPEGRHLYKMLGFLPTNEMRRQLIDP